MFTGVICFVKCGFTECHIKNGIYINIYFARIDIHRMSKSMSTGLSEDIYHIMTYQIIYQTTCSNICQIECQKICHINCHHHNTCQVECEPSNMSECMSDR